MRPEAHLGEMPGQDEESSQWIAFEATFSAGLERLCLPFNSSISQRPGEALRR